MKKTCLLSSVSLLISLICISSRADLIYYDGNGSNSTFSNSTLTAKGMTYMYPNTYNVMHVNEGCRTVDGSGDPDGNEYFDLNPTAGDKWDQAGLYDSVSGNIGGGGVEGVMYVGFLVKAHYGAGSVSERKSGDLPYGRYFGLDLLRDSNDLLGLGNAWGAWAYSAYGSICGDQDLRHATNGVTYIAVNTATHLMVARIAFHANAADDISVWLDPDPVDGDSQNDEIRRYIVTGKGDMSFNRIAYRAGNMVITNAVDFDEVRIGTSWADITPIHSHNKLLWYDGQGTGSLFTNTIYNSSGLHYQMPNGENLKVDGGKRITPGTGDEGTDVFPLDLEGNTIWQDLSLYDPGTGLIGGGDVNGVVYFGALVRAQNPVSGSTEPTEAFVQLTRPGLNRFGAVGLGNGMNPWAYSIVGVFGDHCDMKQESGGTTYLSYNTSVHMMVAKITFKGNANDSIIAWLDPNPDNGDAQEADIRRSETFYNDLSFNQVGYRSGNLGAMSTWEFDEVRIATSWEGIMPTHYGTIIMLQ